MNKCVRCFSYAINPDMYGREAGVDLDLCDVCYWRKRADALRVPRATAATALAEWNKRADTISRATVAAALRELRAKLDSMMFNERHATPFTAIQKAQVELNATIAKLGLAEAQEEKK